MIWLKINLVRNVYGKSLDDEYLNYNINLFSILNIFASGIILSNLKLTGLIYTVIVLFVFIMIKIIYEYRKFTIFKIILNNYFFVVTISIALIVMSYHPYIQNIIAHRHPLWPFLGKDSPISLLSWSAISWSPYNKFITLLITYFLIYPATYPPFSFLPSIKSFVAADYSICALGPFYGVFLIISLYYIIKYFKRILYNIKTDFVCLSIIICIVSTLTSIIVNPYFMYFRYVPQIVLLPAITVIILFKFRVKWFNNKRQKIFIIMSIINSGLFFGGSTILTFYRTYNFIRMEHICLRQECILEIQNHNVFETSLLNQLKEDNIPVIISSCHNKTKIWIDALADKNNNIVCLSN